MPSYSFSFIQYDDITTISGSPKTTTATTGTTGSFSVGAGASPLSITINDDDDIFHDAYIDTGTSQTLAADTVVNGTTYSAGSIVELEFKVSTTTGETFAYIRIDGVNVGIGGPYGSFPQAGQSYTISGSSDGQLETFDDMACFAAGIRIGTACGQRLVETLTPGDQVLTLENGPQPLLWIGRRDLSATDLAARPEWAPIRILAGQLGNARDLLVSPQHRMLISDWRAQLFFGEDNVLVPACALVDGHSIVREPTHQCVTYFHLLFGRHEVVFSEGSPSESYYPCGDAASANCADTSGEVLDLFPGLKGYSAECSYGPTAHPVVRTKLARIISAVRAA